MRRARTFLSWIVTSSLAIGLGLAAAGAVHASAPTSPASPAGASRTTPAPPRASASSVTAPVANPAAVVVGHDDGSDWSGSASRTPGASSSDYGGGSGDH
ncbi:MAG: hypothetical protein ACP5PB_03135 [Acidimicrobiales bacterium]